MRPVTANEFMAQYVTLVHTLPRIAGAIVAAAPPVKTLSFQSPPPSEPDTRNIHIAALRSAPSLSNTLTDMKLRDMGSNAWAIAAERSENGKGLLLANPHYPWYGLAIRLLLLKARSEQEKLPEVVRKNSDRVSLHVSKRRNSIACSRQ